MHLKSPWRPRLADVKASPSEQLMMALADDIIEGRLAVGARLPPQRDLADELAIGLGTVTKAYGILERRGLIRSERGRGSFVSFKEARNGHSVNLGVNTPPPMLSEPTLAKTLQSIAKQVDPSLLTRYAPPFGHDEHRRQMAKWLLNAGIEAEPENLLLCNGAQQALAIALSLLCAAGAPVLTEAVTYPGALLLAKHSGYRLVPIDLDDGGLEVAALERELQCTASKAVLYVTPNLHNPTTITMGAARRRDVARLCRIHGAMIVEDDTYAMSVGSRQTPLAALAPERTFHISSLSKSLTPGLKIGALVMPREFTERAEFAIRSMGMQASALSCAVMSQWLLDGTAESMVDSIRAETARRANLAATLLADVPSRISCDAFHFWLPLPREKAERLHAMAAGAGIALTHPAAVTVADSHAASGLRVCIGAPSLPDLTGALTTLARLAREIGQQVPPTPAAQ